MPIKLAVFDLAGTTVKDRNDVPRVLQEVLMRNEISVSLDDAVAVMGIPKPVAIRQLLLKNDTGSREISAEWIDEIHDEFTAKMISFYESDPFVAEMEGASEVFDLLKRSGVKVFVDTGFSRVITDVLLRRMGWLRNSLIDGSVTSDEVLAGRPAPDMIFRAMVMAGVSTVEDVAKIGDTISDLEEGRNAGCRFVIGVASGAHSRDTLKRHFHTHIVDNIEQVPALLVRAAIVNPTNLK